MTIKRIKNTAVLLSLISILSITTGCNSKQGIESSKLGEKVEKQTKVLGLEDDESAKKELKSENKLESTNRSKEFNKTELIEAKERMKESFQMKSTINENQIVTLTKDDRTSLITNYNNLIKYNTELETQFAKYPNLTQIDYDNSIKILDNMINEIKNMNKIQNNSNEFKGLLVNTLEGLVTTKNYITQSRNQDITLQQAVSVPELLKNCIDIYNDNMASILTSISDYVNSK